MSRDRGILMNKGSKYIVVLSMIKQKFDIFNIYENKYEIMNYLIQINSQHKKHRKKTINNYIRKIRKMLNS